MKHFARFIVIVFLVVLGNLSYGEEFRYLRTMEGLLDGEITSIAQDSIGNIWIGSYIGLTKYDGTRLTNYRPDLTNSNSIPDKKIKKLFVDSKNNLWILSGRFLCNLNQKTDVFETIEFERSGSEELNILYISEYKEYIIIHTVEGFYYLINDGFYGGEARAKKIEVLENGLPGGHYFYFSHADKKDFFLVTQHNQSLHTLFKAEVLANPNNLYIEIKPFATFTSAVNDIEIDSKNGIVYMGTSNGLASFSLNNANKKENVLTGVYISHVFKASNHRIYCAGNNPELFYYDLHNGQQGKHSPNPNKLGTLLNGKILNITEDFSGNLWIGHQGLGISILNLYPKGFISFSQDPLEKRTLNSNTILSFNESLNEIIIGCRYNGVNIITKEDVKKGNSNFISLNLPTSNPNQVYTGVWDIKKDSDDNYWLATEMGLYILSNTGNNWEINRFSTIPEINDLIWKIFIDKNNNIWCGTFNGGIILIPGKTRNSEKKYFRYKVNPENLNSISDNFVSEFFLDSKNRFWIGTLNGLNLLEGEYDELHLTGNIMPELRFKKYFADKLKGSNLNNNEINCLYENYDGNIWIATSGGGINILNPESNTFSYITTQNGLPSNDIFGILPDAMGKLWISSLNGLVCYDQLNDSLTFSVFDRLDGVQGDVFMKNAHFKLNDGALLFGGDNGFSFFEPENIHLNSIEPRIAISEFYFQNEKVSTGDTIRNGFILDKPINHINKIVLPPNKNYFKIVVSTLHYQAPQKNKFTYILEGYMRGWGTNLTSEKAIEFANLPYGKYDLKIKAISPDRIYSSETKEIQIEIEPPWYRTWYMSSIIVLLIFSALAGLIYIIVNRQRLIYIRKINEIKITNNENKMMFLTNIAHELRTPLSLVIAPIEDLVKNFDDTNSNWKSHLQLIHRNSNYLLRLINQIIDFRKLNAGGLTLKAAEIDIVRLIKDVVLNFKVFENKRKINLVLDVPSNSVIVPIDSQKMEEILYNLISNAFKNTKHQGSIKVSMHVLQNSGSDNKINKIRITVFNEGKEIPEKHHKLIFERFYKINENDEGAGIGLSFAKSLVELHNGEISVENISEKGVAFHVDLFFDNEIIFKPQPEDISYSFTKEKINFAYNNDEKKEEYPKVLIVEDNSELRDFLQQVISRNYNCLVAKNGKEGWELVNSQKPSIVVSDIIMSELDGFELCYKIKEKKDICHIPVILLTAKDSATEKEKGFEVGADAYITKPFDINLLLSQIKRLIKNRQLIHEKYLTQNFMVEIDTNHSKDQEFLTNVKELLEKNISDPDFNVNRLSEELNISTTQLYRRIKALTGYSPVEFIRIVKLQKAYTLLGQRTKTVKEVCFACGFNNLSYFIKCFKEQFGITPASFRDNGKVAGEVADTIELSKM